MSLPRKAFSAGSIFKENGTRECRPFLKYLKESAKKEKTDGIQKNF